MPPIAKPSPVAAAVKLADTPVPPPSSEPTRPAASFKEVKFLAVNGSRTSASDVVVAFSDGDVTVQSRDGKSTAAVLPYRGITKATYTNARDPQWDASLSAPTARLDVPGILGRARHWLVLQGPDQYLILRLDGNDRLEVLKAFEERSGISIERAAKK